MKLSGEYIHEDWRNVLPSLKDKSFDLAIVDPPYFDGPNKKKYYGRSVSSQKVKRSQYEILHWKDEIPNQDYFKELCRVSKHQIIWGINYFEFAGSIPGRIIWDKYNSNTSFSDCEIASCSFHDSTRIFRYMWNGMCQGKSIKEGHIQQGNKKLNEKRIHQTQKPVNLYKWLVMNYTKPDFKILDTHVGSASSLIAFEAAGLTYLGIEKDEKMYRRSMDRLKEYLRVEHARLFD